MAYPIFDETMVDLTWEEIDKAGKENYAIFIPVSVIEEHGPHLDLATDVYLTHKLAKKCKKALTKLGENSLIAPPYYWGINRCTGSFPGSFTVREKTLEMILTDIITSLKKWGFSNIYLLNIHGDYFHITAILKAIQNIKNKLNLNISYIMDIEQFKNFGLEEYKKSILLYDFEGLKEDLSEYSFSDYADIHAGGEETSAMIKDFPNSVKNEKLQNLEDSKIPWDQLFNWFDDNGREMTPKGYCGNPSNINLDEIEKWDRITSNVIAKSIYKDIKGVV